MARSAYAEGEVDIDGVADVARQPHRRGGDEEGRGPVAGLEHHGLSDWQLAIVQLLDALLEAALHPPAEGRAVQQIDAASHVAEAVGGADDRIRARLQDLAEGGSRLPEYL